MKGKKILVLIFILALIFRLLFVFLVPIFEKPDEKQHFEYIKFVADNKKLPIEKGNQRDEFYQPPFYHILTSFILRLMRLFIQDIWHQIIFLRILSVIVSMFTLYFTYKITSIIFSDIKLILGTLAFVSLLPSHINMNSTFTNANFGDLLSTLIIYMTLKILIEKENRNNLIILGIVTGVALITRLSVISAILTIPFTFIIKYYPDIKKTIKPLAIITVIALSISTWHLIRNYNLYGDFLGLGAVRLAIGEDKVTVNMLFVPRLLGWTFITFWASFGRTNNIFLGNLTSTRGVITSIVSYSLLLLITLASLYGLFRFFKKYRKNKNLLSKKQKKAFTMIFLYLTISGLSFISFNLHDFQPQGRLLFPIISIISILFTFGIYTLTTSAYRQIFLHIYILSFIILNIASLISVMLYYA